MTPSRLSDHSLLLVKRTISATSCKANIKKHCKSGGAATPAIHDAALVKHTTEKKFLTQDSAGNTNPRNVRRHELGSKRVKYPSGHNRGKSLGRTSVQVLQIQISNIVLLITKIPPRKRIRLNVLLMKR